MPVRVISKLQQVNDELYGKTPSFYLLNANDVQFDTTNGDGKPGDNNDLYTVINNLRNSISLIPKFEIIVCDELPTSNINLNALYLMRNAESSTNNLYTEYVYKNGDWEVLGIRKSEITNMVTTDTTQNISGAKTFIAPVYIGDGSDNDNFKIIPVANNTGSIGGIDSYFKNGFIKNISSDSISPISTNANIGTSTLKWLNAYITNVESDTINSKVIKDNGVDIKTLYAQLIHTHKLSDIDNLVLDNTIVKTLDGLNEVLSVNTGYISSDADRNYAVKSDNGKLYVNVPWVNTNQYVHPTYTSRESNIYKITVDSTGHISNAAVVTSADIANLGVAITDTTYTPGTGLSLTGNQFGLKTASSDQLGGVKIGSNINIDANGIISVDLSPYALTTSLNSTNSRVSTLETAVSKYLDGTDETLDQISELAEYVKKNKEAIDNIPSQLLQVTADANELNKLDGATVTTTEINYLSGVTSGIQGQLNTITNCYIKKSGDTMTGTLQLSGVNALTSATSTTYGLGTNGQVLKSNGSKVYWADDNNTTYTFTNKGATLNWSTTTTIATVGGTNITVTMPANPNTDNNTQNFNTLIIGNASNSTSEVASVADPYIVLLEKLTSSGAAGAVDSIQVKGGTGVTVSGGSGAVTINGATASYDASTETLIISLAK